MCKANHAHGRTANMKPEESQLVGGSQLVQLLKANRTIKPGEELLWNYNAVTDDSKDKLLEVPCSCKDPRCPGCIIKYVPSLGHKQSRQSQAIQAGRVQKQKRGQQGQGRQQQGRQRQGRQRQQQQQKKKMMKKESPPLRRGMRQR
jgi:hypothetical protein